MRTDTKVMLGVWGIIAAGLFIMPRSITYVTQEVVTEEMIAEAFNAVDSSCGTSISHLAYDPGTTWSMKPGEDAVVTDQKPPRRYFYHEKEVWMWAARMRRTPKPTIQTGSVNLILEHGHIKSGVCKDREM